jgi:pilus assembly protein CpaB
VGTTAPPQIHTTKILVARADLGLSSELTPQNIETVEWPTGYLPAGAMTNPEELNGRIVRLAIPAGEVIRESALLPAGAEGGLAQLISENFRAVSVKVDPIVGVAGFVRPGTRVDVLATIKRTDWKSKQSYAKVVLQNVKVLAIDQKLEEVHNSEPELVSVVTLEVELSQAEKLVFMAHQGRLQLALRGQADDQIVKTSGTTVKGLFGSGSTKKSYTPRHTVEVVKGTRVTTRSF